MTCDEHVTWLVWENGSCECHVSKELDFCLQNEGKDCIFVIVQAFSNKIGSSSEVGIIFFYPKCELQLQFFIYLLTTSTSVYKNKR